MNCKVGFIGFGSMGRMIFGKIAASKSIPEGDFYVTNRTYEKILPIGDAYPGVHTLRSNGEVAKNSDVLFLCVKPLEIKSVIEEIKDAVSPNTHIVSLNGSVLFAQLESVCKRSKISKAIPSVTAEVNLSQTLVCHNAKVSEGDKAILAKLLSTFGQVIELPEGEIGIASELVSCMPGFIASIFDEICREAKAHTELSDGAIIEMVQNTLYGTSRLMLEKKLSFEEIIARVATKGGITEEVVKVIHGQFPKTVSDLFVTTLEKRRLTTEKAIRQFDSGEIR